MSKMGPVGKWLLIRESILAFRDETTELKPKKKKKVVKKKRRTTNE